MTRTTAFARGLVLALVGLIALSGCDFSVYKMPLPGGADVGSNPLVVKAKFSDVLDLVPQSTVKVADVTVGKVTDVSLDGYTAVVTMEIRRDVHLPDNTRADIRQTSLLGEKFVSLSAPAGGGGGELGDNDVITDTGKNPEVEEVLGALSLLLNGGGVAQLKTIASELNTTLKGREGSARSLLTQFRLLMTQLDDNKAAIVTAIESLNRLSISVNKQQGAIDAALDDLPSALRSINSQRADLVKMLQALDQLSSVGVRVINASKTATIDSLQNLTPILSKLVDAGDAFPKSLNVFLTYPFVDEVVGRNPTVARNLHMGDYTNLSIKLDISVPVGGTSGPPITVPTSISTSLPTIIDPTVILDDVTRCLQSGDLSSAACQRVLNSPAALLKLKQECQKPRNKDKAVCQELNLLPGGGILTGLPTVIPGLPRPGAGSTTGASTTVQGPTVQQLMNLYDPDLVSLLIPGMVAQ
jgi:phospholipid/cholesterol/gamma-HCH transport system substrate-binding protein